MMKSKSILQKTIIFFIVFLSISRIGFCFDTAPLRDNKIIWYKDEVFKNWLLNETPNDKIKQKIEKIFKYRNREDYMRDVPGDILFYTLRDDTGLKKQIAEIIAREIVKDKRETFIFRRNLIINLGDFGDTGAIPVLWEIFRNDEKLRYYAAVSLLNLGADGKIKDYFFKQLEKSKKTGKHFGISPGPLGVSIIDILRKHKLISDTEETNLRKYAVTKFKNVWELGLLLKKGETEFVYNNLPIVLSNKSEMRKKGTDILLESLLRRDKSAEERLKKISKEHPEYSERINRAIRKMNAKKARRRNR